MNTNLTYSASTGPVKVSVGTKRVIKIYPMLSTPVDKSMIGSLATDPNWAFFQKYDGRRLISEITQDGRTTAKFYGRDGKKVQGPERLQRLFKRLPTGHYIIDGELMSDGVLRVFDAPQVAVGGVTIVNEGNPYSERIQVLSGLCSTLWGKDKAIQLAPRATDAEHKLVFFNWLKDHDAEGIIARQMDAPYLPGVRSKSSIKIKFTQSVDCFVLRIGEDGKNNLVLGVYDKLGKDRHVVEIGKVSALTGDGPSAKVGTVLDVQYLSFSEEGHLLQPVNPRLKTDKAATDCLIDQLKPLDQKEVEVYGT
jgi:ATP-dependent DNA ligase